MRQKKRMVRAAPEKRRKAKIWGVTLGRGEKRLDSE